MERHSIAATYAYPTKITDPAGAYSQVKYRYDIGANVEASSPAPAGQTYGKTTKRVYDAQGRVQKDSVYINTTEKSYTRYEYPTNGIQSKVYSTITDTNANGVGDSADEVLAETWSDGAGRVLKSRTPHTFDANGNTLTWAATFAEYDILGRVKKQSVPTEVNSSWAAAGDDAAREFLWTYQKYDWKGRVVRKINTDGIDQATYNDSDILISYEGCGCAGGQITTIQSEMVPRDDTTGNARRVQKIYEDILGRGYKTLVYKWDGTTAYTTTEQFFNGRDQVTRTKQTDNTSTATPQTFREVTTTYDGHGRVYQSHRPAQRDANDDPKYTTYSYNPDNSVQSIADGRGAIAGYTYNSIGLVTNVAWTVPTGSGIADPADVSFSYDSLGNRTQMSDSLGTVVYAYDALSRMTSETRQFSDQNTGFTNNTIALTYSYTPSGQLKSYANSFGTALQVNYSFDKLGRTSSVTGASGAGSFDYADNPHYRAWGSLTHLEYGNGTEMNIESFNNKLQATSFELKKDATAILDKSYDFYADGSLRSETNSNNAKFDRLYRYDHMSRMTEAKTGAEARGTTDSAMNIPFGNAFQYDAFGNLTQRTFKHFSRGPSTMNWSYSNDRLSMPSGSYDNEGNGLKDPDTAGMNYTYDAANQMGSSHYEHYEPGNVYEDDQLMRYDGDGMLVVVAATHDPVDGEEETTVTYRIRSTVLGSEVVFERGELTRNYVRANGTVVAVQNDGASVVWMHKDAALTSLVSTGADGHAIGGNGEDTDQHELDPMGNSVGFSDPYVGGIPDFGVPLFSGESHPSLVNGVQASHTIDGLRVPPSQFGRMFDFAFGGIFGAVERTARLSASPVGYRTETRYLIRTASGPPTLRNSPAARGGPMLPTTADGESEIYGTYTVTSPIYSSTWSVSSSFIPVNDEFGRVLVATELGRERDRSSQMSCANALNQAGKTSAGLARAQAALRQIYQTVGDVNIARLLGAIGIQESDFISRNQLGGGPGRGVFQIEPKTYGITEAEANNLQTAANAIANNWSRVWGDILTGLDNGGFDVTSSNIQYWALAGLARVHNRGRGGVVVSGNSGSSSSGSLLDLAIQKGDISILDNAGTNRDRRYTQTANGTYVRNVMDLFFSCFGG
ncbi:MAG: hypothetical protein IT173_15940 [Acidobacteria bacterium]|nr:hypothetical protein [Acidobacteriota bacterium]